MHAMFDQLIHAAGGRGGREVVELPLEKIEPDPEQPRKTSEGIDELAASLRAVGVQQPLLVRPHPDRRGLGAAAPADDTRLAPAVVRALGKS